MAAFLFDDFTDTNATALTSHTGPVGATWTLPGSESAATAIIQTGPNTGESKLRISNTNGSSVGHYLSSGTPPSADYWVKMTWTVLTVPANGGIGITLRTDSTCANCYLVQYSFASTAWQLFRKVSGSFTQIGSNVAQTLTTDVDYELYFSVVGSQIDFTVDGVSKFSTTDANVAATGKVGLRIGEMTGGASATTSIHMDQIVGDSGTETVLRSIGDSTTVGVKASPQETKRWPYILGQRNGWNDRTRCLSSTQIIDHCSADRIASNNQVYLPFAPTTNDRWCWLTGYNDMRYFGTDANGLETYTRILRAAVAWLTRPAASVYQANNGAWSEVGAWTGLVTHNINSRYTSTPGDKTTASISGTAITVCYQSRFGFSDGANTITVKIDGNTAGTINTNFGSAGGYNNNGVGTARYVPMAIRYGGLSGGSHTVEISHTGSGGTYLQLLFVVGNGGSVGSRVLLADPFKVSNYNLSSPYNVGSDTAVANYSAAIAGVVADAVADGYDATHIDTNYWFDPANDLDADGIHPNNAGYAHIADAFGQFLVQRIVISSHAVIRASTY